MPGGAGLLSATSMSRFCYRGFIDQDPEKQCREKPLASDPM